MKNKVIILLSGYKRSGKDTIASKVKELVPEVKLHAFAEELKRMASHLFQLDYSFFTSQDLKERPLLKYANTSDEWGKMLTNMQKDDLHEGAHTPRSLLILLGSFIRYYDKNYWADKVIDRILTSPEHIHIVTDCRFKNEIERAKERLTADDNYKVVHIRIHREPPKSNDPSERDLDDITPQYIIDNTGDIEHAVFEILNVIAYMQ